MLKFRRNLAFSFREVTPLQVRDAIFALKNSPSRDIFGFNSKVFKCMGNHIYLPLSRLINSCIRRAIYPDILKTAKVVPIYKKGSIDDPDSFRPVSLLPLVSKVFEKILKTQISDRTVSCFPRFIEQQSIWLLWELFDRSGNSPAGYIYL